MCLYLTFSRVWLYYLPWSKESRAEITYSLSRTKERDFVNARQDLWFPWLRRHRYRLTFLKIHLDIVVKASKLFLYVGTLDRVQEKFVLSENQLEQSVPRPIGHKDKHSTKEASGLLEDINKRAQVKIAIKEWQNSINMSKWSESVPEMESSGSEDVPFVPAARDRVHKPKKSIFGDKAAVDKPFMTDDTKT